MSDESKKTLGAICLEVFGREGSEAAAAAVIAEHERRKPVPDDVVGLVNRLRVYVAQMRSDGLDPFNPEVLLVTEAADDLTRLASEKPTMDAETVAKGWEIARQAKDAADSGSVQRTAALGSAATFIESLLPRHKSGGERLRDILKNHGIASLMTHNDLPESYKVSYDAAAKELGITTEET